MLAAGGFRRDLMTDASEIMLIELTVVQRTGTRWRDLTFPEAPEAWRYVSDSTSYSTLRTS